jgi:hypothetical protein
MSKKKSIISYEKLNIEQKKQLLMAFPDGFAGAMTKMNNPITGEAMDALLWETDEAIYLVKLPKQNIRAAAVDDDDDEEFEDEEFGKFDGNDEDDSSDDDDEEDTYGDEPEEEEDTDEE